MFSANSDTWKAVVKKLEKDRSEALEELILAKEHVDIAKLQGKLLFIEELLTTYPRQLKPGND